VIKTKTKPAQKEHFAIIVGAIENLKLIDHQPNETDINQNGLWYQTYEGNNVFISHDKIFHTGYEAAHNHNSSIEPPYNSYSFPAYMSHTKERGTEGITYYDVIDMDDYLAYTIARGIELYLMNQYIVIRPDFRKKLETIQRACEDYRNSKKNTSDEVMMQNLKIMKTLFDEDIFPRLWN